MNKRLSTLIASRTASEADLAALSVSEVLEVKSNPEIVQFPQPRTGEIKAVDEKARTVELVWTDESVDSDGDILTLDGWDLKRYLKNPVVLWGHDSRNTPPIGRAKDIQLHKNAPTPFATVVIEFATKEQNPMADTVFQLIKGGFLKGISPGLRVLEIAEMTEEQRRDAGLGRWGIKSLRQMLLELSIVSIPANENALRRELAGMAEKGLIGDSDRRELERGLRVTERDYAKRLYDLREELASIFDKADEQDGEAISVKRTDKGIVIQAGGEDCAELGGEWKMVRFVDNALEVSDLDDLPEDGFDSELAKLCKGVDNRMSSLEIEVDALRREVERASDINTKQAEAHLRLVQALSDLTRKIHSSPGGDVGGNKPDADQPDAGEGADNAMKSLEEGLTNLLGKVSAMAAQGGQEGG